MNNESPVNVPVSRSLSARAKRFYEARRRPDSGAGCLAVMLAFLVIFGLLFFIYYTDMKSDDKKGKLKTANVRLMTHPDFQSLLETHVMGDVFLVDDQNKIGVINDNFGPGRQEHTHRFGLKEVIKYCSERAAIDSSTIVLKFVNLVMPNSDNGYAKIDQRQILEKDIYITKIICVSVCLSARISPEPLDL